MMLDSPHTSAPILMRGTSLPQRAFHPTDHIQQDIHPTDNPPPSARRAGRERHDDESDDDEGVQRAEPDKVCVLW